MSSNSFLDEIRKIAEQASAAEGCYLYDLEFVGAGNGRTLRVYIDKDGASSEDGGTGVSIDDCSSVSRALNQFLDTKEEEIPGGQYTLEVSSPGLERVLKEPWHFEKAIGQKISVKAFAPLLQFNANVPELDKAKQVIGTLRSFDELGVKVEWSVKDGQREVFVPFASLTKAHVVFDFVDSSESSQARAEGSKGKGPKFPHKKPKKTAAANQS